MTKAHIAASLVNTGGDGRDRTADLLIANQSLSQLSYAPDKKEKFYAARKGASILLLNNTLPWQVFKRSGLRLFV
jgi:hypothetical protein